MKKFESHFSKKYPRIFNFHSLSRNEIEGNADLFFKNLIELIKIHSVRVEYENDKAKFISLSYLLIKDDEITLEMALEMEPYQLAILKLNDKIDNKTRVYAEINWK
jgi:hypothetical protein